MISRERMTMGRKKDKKKELEEKAELSMQEAVEILDEELTALMKATATDLEKLRPKVRGRKTYDLLIKEVQKATQKNEDIAALRERIELLGVKAVKTARNIAKKLS